MTITRILISFSLLALTAACSEPGDSSRQTKLQPPGVTSAEFGEYIVHFNALRTDDLTPEVAKVFQITRSPNRVMLNVSVVRKADNASVNARVSATVHNLNQQLKDSEIVRRTEQDAIYYISVIDIGGEEILNFAISVTPEGSDRPPKVIRFQRQFYTD